MIRLQVKIQGRVQGVGFRPFIYRLAHQFNLKGWVKNSAQGVILEVEGDRLALEVFLAQVQEDLPAPAQIETLTIENLPWFGYAEFEIRPSEAGLKTAVILPDLATCSACLAEIFDPGDRRFHYPFTNCTHCGPRYSIIEALPYDRQFTSMKDFEMCAECLAEYHNPGDRRFHAQPNACGGCGPQIEYWDSQGQVLAQGEAVLSRAIDALGRGKILAVKGLGGFQLWVDAHHPGAIADLRQRKQRPAKPLALMYPDLESIRDDCDLDRLSMALLTSSPAPIVLLRKKKNSSLPSSLAPGTKDLGVMLAYTPLHHLLLADFAGPVVATSGNLAGEPICIENAEALDHLAAIADYFLVHDRPILRAVDDSVVRLIQGKMMMLRRGRGYAPLPLTLKSPIPVPCLALGGQLKNTVAIAIENRAYVSQHIGDLDSPRTVQALEQTLTSLASLYDFTPQAIAHDLHPDYLSTHYAQQFPQPKIAVQHHHAHILAVMAEHHLSPPVLGVAWDGTGYGLDGTIWGGEFLRIEAQGWHRIAHLKPFPLLGGEQAIKQPRRIALALLQNIPPAAWPPSLQTAFTSQELSVFAQMQARALNCPSTSSMGRLFDGISALLGLCHDVSFEGQAAIALESQAEESCTDLVYPWGMQGSLPQIIDWQPLVQDLLQDLKNSGSVELIATKFHNSLVSMLLSLAQSQGIRDIVLGGGCFQNRYLLEKSIIELQSAGFRPHWPQQFPPNDGGLALGQLAAIEMASLAIF